MAIKAEYIWIDGTEPTARLRSKTKVITGDADLASLPIWGFDGSSTNQAPGKASDCVLRPVFACPDPIRGGDDLRWQGEIGTCRTARRGAAISRHRPSAT